MPETALFIDEEAEAQREEVIHSRSHSPYFKGVRIQGQAVWLQSLYFKSYTVLHTPQGQVLTLSLFELCDLA
jgi:hypothetical protein